MIRRAALHADQPGPTRSVFYILLCFLLSLMSRTSCCDILGSKTICSGKNYAQLPEDIPRYVTDLDVSKNKMKKIDDKTYRSYNAIKKLNVSHNELIIIHSNAFYYLTEMESLDLSHNLLSTVYDTILNNNAKMRSFYLSYNKELSLIPRIYSKSLETFMISNCGIKEINAPTFLGVESVQVLDLSYNLLTKIASHSFDPINSLKVLNISNNKLIDANFIDSDCALSLDTLDISFNSISSASFTIFEMFLSLKTVHFHNNSWVCNGNMEIIYKRFLEKERNLNLKCVSPSGKMFRSWHDYYVIQDQPEISCNYPSTTDVPETTTEIGKEISCTNHLNLVVFSLTIINLSVTFIVLTILCIWNKGSCSAKNSREVDEVLETY